MVGSSIEAAAATTADILEMAGIGFAARRADGIGSPLAATATARMVGSSIEAVAATTADIIEMAGTGFAARRVVGIGSPLVATAAELTVWW
ncbi:hypothetical protein [Thioflavicoccus mobilis]|uniref:hypothetical protein n=1 Tax=Thioflavicoccus mobilis TaxID=80679 RepID=UPI00059FF138|nr:hypothetical protein [Thioflavicoccus mobilis]